MADLIKKIKIKKQDGTFTDYIPIGAEAQNISTSDGDSVQSKLNKKPYYYNNIADMKADTKLKVGDMAITLGYYEVNDNGGAEYKIVNGNYTNDDGRYHKLNNNLYAELIIRNNMVTAQQVGIKADATFDCTEKIKKFFLTNTQKTTLFFPAGRYYLSECHFSHDYTGQVYILGQSEHNHTYLTFFVPYEDDQKYIIKLGGPADYSIPADGSRSSLQVSNCFIHKVTFYDTPHQIEGTNVDDINFGILALDQCYSLSLDIGFRYCKGQCIYIRDSFEINIDHLYFRDGSLKEQYAIIFFPPNTKSMSNNNNSNITIGWFDIETLGHAMIMHGQGYLDNAIIDNIILEETGNEHGFNYAEVISLINTIRNDYIKHPYFVFDRGSSGTLTINTWDTEQTCAGYWTDESDNRHMRSMIKLNTAPMKVVFNEIHMGGSAQSFPFFEADFEKTYDSYFYKKPWNLNVHNLDLDNFCGTQDAMTNSRYYFTEYTQTENSGCVYFDIHSNGVMNPDLITCLPSKMYVDQDLFKLSLFQMNVVPAANQSTHPNCRNPYSLKNNKKDNLSFVKFLPAKADTTIEFSGCTVWQSSTTITQGHCYELELYDNSDNLLTTLAPTDHDVGRYTIYKEIFTLNQTTYPALNYIRIKTTYGNYLDYIDIR